MLRPAIGPLPVRLGWRRPSEAKELFRAFRGCAAPYPAAPRRLATLARAAERLLHRTLCACLAAVLRAAGACASRSAVQELLVGCDAGGSGAASYNCAFDLFHYPNAAAAAATPYSNCGPHVDRGFLSAIVMSQVPGLVLWDRGERTRAAAADAAPCTAATTTSIT